jgi:hypothetical protein
MRKLLKLEPGWYKNQKVYIVDILESGELIIKKQDFTDFTEVIKVKKYVSLVHKLFGIHYWSEEIEYKNSLIIPNKDFRRNRKKINKN